MAVSTATLGREKKITTLADRLFVITGPDRTKTLLHVERELVKANPHLAQPDGFKMGAVVVIPGHLGLEVTDRVETPRPDLNGTLDQASVQIRLAQQQMDEAFKTHESKTAETIAKLSETGFAATLRKQWPQSTKTLPNTLEKLSKQAEENKVSQARFGTALTKAETHIADLKTLPSPKE